LLGFNMLRYDLAIDGDVMGCISESMINTDDQELIEGVKYLQAYSPQFDPINKDHRTWYTFNLIEESLKVVHLGHLVNDILQIIVFDALIGNGDRHQENWAIISHRRLLTDIIDEIEKSRTTPFSGVIKLMVQFLKWTQNQLKEYKQKIPSTYYDIDNQFAPIYDNGSSLGRELLSEKVDIFLSSDDELKKYISKGTSEIHWENKKLSHFHLIRNLMSTTRKKNLKIIIDRIVQKFDGPKIEQLIKQVDKEVPETHAGYRVPDSRKRLIYKLITLRFEMLKELIDE